VPPTPDYAPTGAAISGRSTGASEGGSLPCVRMVISKVSRLVWRGLQPVALSLSVETTQGWMTKWRLPGGVSDARSFHIIWPKRPQLAEPIALRLVARVLEVGHAADRLVLVDRDGVVRKRAVCGGRRGHEHLPHSGRGRRLEDVVRPAHVDLVHRVLVVHGVEHEGQVHQCIRVLALEELPNPWPVADVELRERHLGVERARRPNVRDDD